MHVLSISVLDAILRRCARLKASFNPALQHLLLEAHRSPSF